MRSRTFISIFAVIFLSSPGDLAAYEILTSGGQAKKWKGNSLTFYVHDGTIPEGSSPWWTSLREAVTRFNDNPSNFRVALTPHTGSVGLNNGRSEIWLSNSISHPAATYPEVIVLPIVIPLPPFVVGYIVHMDEADIIINNSGTTDWTDSNWRGALRRYGGDYRSLEGTTLHEMGHATGLGHVNYEYNIMGRDFEHLHVNGSRANFYLGEDAADGLVYLYGLNSDNIEDVGVVHWKYAGQAGEYSDHTKTILSDTSDNVLPSVWADYDGDGDNDERHYRVSPGQQVKVEFIYENNGAHTQNDVQVGFYLSTGQSISTRDTRIGGRTLSLGRGDVYEARHTVRLPSSLVSGQRYWIGAVVDETDSISEQVEWNNATYIPIVAN